MRHALVFGIASFGLIVTTACNTKSSTSTTKDANDGSQSSANASGTVLSGANQNAHNTTMYFYSQKIDVSLTLADGTQMPVKKGVWIPGKDAAQQTGGVQIDKSQLPYVQDGADQGNLQEDRVDITVTTAKPVICKTLPIISQTDLAAAQSQNNSSGGGLNSLFGLLDPVANAAPAATSTSCTQGFAARAVALVKNGWEQQWGAHVEYDEGSNTLSIVADQSGGAGVGGAPDQCQGKVQTNFNALASGGGQLQCGTDPSARVGSGF